MKVVEENKRSLNQLVKFIRPQASSGLFDSFPDEFGLVPSDGGVIEQGRASPERFQGGCPHWAACQIRHCESREPLGHPIHDMSRELTGFEGDRSSCSVGSRSPVS